MKLAGFDAAAKIKVIKEVRSITALGLKEAKELVSPQPSIQCQLASTHPFIEDPQMTSIPALASMSCHI